MATDKKKPAFQAAASPADPSQLLARYGCAPVHFSGTDDALYERYLTSDDVVAVDEAVPRERFEAVARSVRDVLSQRWVLTEKTYLRENPKPIRTIAQYAAEIWDAKPCPV